MRMTLGRCMAAGMAAAALSLAGAAQAEPAARMIVAQNETEAPADAAAKPKSDLAGKLETPEAKTAYAIGLQLGMSVKDSPYPIEMELLEQGLRDVMNDKEPALTQMEVQEVLLAFRQAMQTAYRDRKMKEGEANLVKATAYLDENKAKEGVKTTESGLQYKMITEGSGKNPAATDQVKVHYRGTLTDGTQFDSSYDRGQPASFGLDQVIPGWTEGLQLMKVGGKAQLVIPPDLGYGAGGPDTIPPNSVLLFEVELLEILGSAPAAGDQSITIE